tara:strand:+ start:779 stop:1021 length:243 start_codon:yes stop_codon:yes gene_type:complete
MNSELHDQDEITDVDSTKDSPPSIADLAEQQSPGIAREFWDFLKNNKKWWLLPILLILALLFILVLINGSPLAPLLYPLG